MSSYENTIKHQQGIFNNVLNSSTASCISSCTQTQDLNLTFVNATVGTLDLSQSCQVVGNSCVLKNTIDTNMKNLLNSVAKQENFLASDPLSFNFGDTLSNSTTVEQSIKNLVSQAINTTCQQPSSQTKELNLLFLGGSLESLSIDQTSQISSNTCSINNGIKTTISNTEIANTSQKNTSLGMLAIIGMIIGAIIVGIVIIVVVHGVSKVESAKAPEKEKEKYIKMMEENEENMFRREEASQAQERSYEAQAQSQAMMLESQAQREKIYPPQTFTSPLGEKVSKIKQLPKVIRDLKNSDEYSDAKKLVSELKSLIYGADKGSPFKSI